MKLLAKIKGIHFRIPSKHAIVHKGEHFFHMSYLGFTYIEGHGIHAIAAGGLFLMVFAGIFVAEEVHS